jgi:hypothetical protein
MSNNTPVSTPSTITEPDILWPSIFKHPRTFDPVAENLTYLKYQDVISLDSDSDDDSEDDLDERSDVDDDEVVDIAAEPPETYAESSGPPGVPESQSAMRRLRRSPPGAEGKNVPRHPDRDDDVTEFVESRLASASEAEPSGNRSLVALIDDQFDSPECTTSQGAEQEQEGQHRGGLSRDGLLLRLETPVRYLTCLIWRETHF